MGNYRYVYAEYSPRVSNVHKVTVNVRLRVNRAGVQPYLAASRKQFGQVQPILGFCKDRFVRHT